MDLNSIRNALKREPFCPFEMCLADGRRVLVKHPEFVAMNKRIVIVVDEDSYTETFEPLLVVSVKQVPNATGKNGNGSRKRRPKP